MEQITITLDRSALEQLPANVLVDLLLGVKEAPKPVEIPIPPIDLFTPSGIIDQARHCWTDSENRRLLDNYRAGMTPKLIARLLNRTEAQVKQRIAEIGDGVPQNNRRKWTRSDDDELIYAEVKGTMTRRQIAIKLGRTEKSCQQRLVKLRAEGRLNVVFE